jgi:hypothetical protein
MSNPIKSKSLLEKSLIELLRASVSIVFIIATIDLWLLPQIQALFEDNHGAKVAIINIAKIQNETNITDDKLLFQRIKQIRNILIEDGYIVLDATTVLGRSKKYEIPTSMIDNLTNQYTLPP